MKRLLAAMLCMGSSMAGANEFFAMDNGLRDVKTIAGKADLIKELGYDGVTWRSGKTAEAMRDFTSRGIKMHAFKLKLPVSKEIKEASLPLEDLQVLKGSRAVLWVSLQSMGGDDGDAVRVLNQLNAVAKPMQLPIAIYPHIDTHAECLEEALRVAEQVADDNVGVSMTLCHQLKIKGVQNLEPLLKKALPRLFLVQVSGADAGDTKNMGWDKLVQPLGQGSYDVQPLLKTLQEIGYQGPIGVIGYGIKQPARQHLKQTMDYWRTSLGANADDDWGPFVGPWKRHDHNPVIRLEGKESYSIQNGPQSVIQWKGKWHMFLMTSQPMVTKLAVSDDGLTWKRPHHNHLLKPTMAWEGSYNLAKAAVVRDDEVWLYYFGKKGKTEMCALARSKDLINWKKERKPIFTHKDSRIDGERAFPDCVIKEDGTWYMYYDVGFDYGHAKKPDGYSIGIATSKDGITWTDSLKSPALTTSERTAGSWDDGMVSQCSVTKIGDWFYMLYSGGTNNHGRKHSGKNRMAFGLARAKHPEGPWEKYPHNPVFKPTGNEKDFDGIFLQHACPVKFGKQWRLYYNGWTRAPKTGKRPVGAEYAIGVAVSSAP